ncbi:hypothetical protein SBRCBS47491_007717 [Sporothrix bragantina]|uniref:beta-glucosidase n=1 Tax=Sporothrix bragantina TaxID=671064 RepID=A0ABP0CHC8_9PEZI
MVTTACVTLAAVAAWAQTVSGASVLRRDSVPAGYVAAPYYPSPHGGWTSDWTAAYEKAEALVSSMTLAEKTNITAGTGFFMGSALRVGFPQLCLQDSALGVRSTDHVTAFPAGITTGATWDKDLMLARAQAIGAEFRGKGANIYLGPTIGPLGRKPRGGRNWESFGADPVLQAVGGALTVQGVQEQGVIATVKHLIGYEQEMYRMYNVIMPGYSSNIDDRTLHELYLWPFAEAIRAGAGSVMAAYNAVNGSACSQNSYLLNGLLKDELGFQGFVMSDWLGQMSGVASALAGLDMGMPGDEQIPLIGTSYFMYDLTRAALNGSVPMDRINDMATRVVAAWYQMGQDADFPPPNFSSNTDSATGLLYPGALFSPSGVVNQFVDVQGDHATVARQVATDAITLLQNNGSLLPLDVSRPLVVFGTDAAVNPSGANACTDRACDTGTLGMGWGSGTANYPYFDDPLTALKNRSTGGVTYHDYDSWPWFFAPSQNGDEVAVVFLSSDSGENQDTVEGNHGDRDSAGLAAWHGGDALVKAVANAYSNVVVVVHTVGPIVMDSWINLPSVQAVVVAHLPGQEAGQSLTDVLYGDVTPSGHLPYTIPKQESDYPSSLGLRGFALGQVQDTYSEGLYIDYRYLQKNGIAPRFAFGHGLSYTNFSLTSASIAVVETLTSTTPAARAAKLATPTYSTAIPPASEATMPAGFSTIWRYLYSWVSLSDAEADIAASSTTSYPYPAGYSTTQKAGPPAGGAQGGNAALFDVAYSLSVEVTNTGSKYSGKSVVQAYLQFSSSSTYDTPLVQLRDFAKTDTLTAGGGSQTVTVQLTRKDLSVWDVVQQNWVLPAGLPSSTRYTIWLGEASDQLYTACYTDTLTCESGLAGPSL